MKNNPLRDHIYPICVIGTPGELHDRHLVFSYRHRNDPADFERYASISLDLMSEDNGMAYVRKYIFNLSHRVITAYDDDFSYVDAVNDLLADVEFYTWTEFIVLVNKRNVNGEHQVSNGSNVIALRGHPKFEPDLTDRNPG